MTIKKFWLDQTNLIHWYRKPLIAFIKKKNNHTHWFPDGKLNIFYNCVTKNIELGL